ncbi:hypothetical protein [Lederbergia ruris]|uniref:Uncharacterized protein n=1 Tax=Lederbergia ruris TaxID=217495 RepID=A0ABQ4KJ84_9BACI|nr:hypothetical protein [Lederbergia ruris]GIN57388.1 hypothetical protein J8TS2_17070 [Lederbergia ruris]
MLNLGKEPRSVHYEIYSKYTPAENKLEVIDGVFLPFNNEREKMLLLCLYNMGLQKFVEILPNETKEELINLLKNE